jgi:hypothetical protein
MGSKNGALSVHDVHDLINHIALPPQLPQSEDSNPSVINSNLLQLLQDVTKTFDHRTCGAWTFVSRMLSALDKTEQAKTLRDDLLGGSLTALKPGGKYCIYLSKMFTHAS